MNKSKKGITLIALVITIIVLLILAGISITMLSGENSILSRAGGARNESIESQEKEKIELAYEAVLTNNYDTMNVDEFELESELNKLEGENRVDVIKINENEFEISFTDTGNEYIKSANGITKKSGQSIKKCTAFTYGPSCNSNFINVLYGTGNLVRQEVSANNDTGYVELKEDTSTVISKNVKDYLDGYAIDQLVYLTRDNKLYHYNNSTSILIGENVIKYKYYLKYNGSVTGAKLYYLDQANDLYECSVNDDTTKKIAENVKDYFFEESYNPYYPIFYLDSSNDLYAIGERLVYSNVKDVNQYIGNGGGYRLQFTTEENDLYIVYYGNDVSEDMHNNFAKGLVGKNVKELYGKFYVDQNNNLKKYAVDNWDTILASNVKKFIGNNNDDYCYINQNDELYINDKKVGENVIYADMNNFIDSNNNYYYCDYTEKELISDNVKKCYKDGSYLKNDKTFISPIYSIEMNDVEDYDPDSFQVISNGKKIYLENNAEVIKSGSNWYQDVNGKVYQLVFNINELSW